jgi:hypothetical protein
MLKTMKGELQRRMHDRTAEVGAYLHDAHPAKVLRSLGLWGLKPAAIGMILGLVSGFARLLCRTARPCHLPFTIFYMACGSTELSVSIL